MGVHFWVSQVSIFIIVSTWHLHLQWLSPIFYSDTNKSINSTTLHWLFWSSQLRVTYCSPSVFDFFYSVGNKHTLHREMTSQPHGNSRVQLLGTVMYFRFGNQMYLKVDFREIRWETSRNSRLFLCGRFPIPPDTMRDLVLIQSRVSLPGPPQQWSIRHFHVDVYGDHLQTHETQSETQSTHDWVVYWFSFMWESHRHTFLRRHWSPWCRFKKLG